MKAAVLKQLKSPLVIEDVPVPQFGSKDVLLKVKQCGICVTDIHIANGDRPVGELPFIMGHEGVGIVEEVGNEVTQFIKGDRVLMSPLVSCGMCGNCSVGRDNLCEHRWLIGISPGRQGVYAEYGVIPERNLFKLPEEITFTDGVLITSGLASSFHGARRANFKASETACIYGLGALGKLLVLVLKALGASLIIGVVRREKSLKDVENLGLDSVINSSELDPVEQIKKITGGKGVDVGFEAAGDHEAILQAIASTRAGGRTCTLGVPFYHVTMDFKDDLGFFHEICEKEATIINSWGYLRQEFPMMVKMVKKGLIDFSPCRTKIIPIEEVNEGIRLSQEGDYTRLIIGF
jgi:threonine dehydrogenase-like Zn-dependent dehydrogenase